MRHAYLIIAHNQFHLLKELLVLLENEDNDIFIHLDRKVKRAEFANVIDLNEFSNVNLIQKHSVTWGGHSQIKCELSLIKAALANDNKYGYLHIISGVDLPVKSMFYINEFFERNKGKEFLDFDDVQDLKRINNRCGEYHFFQDIIGRKEIGFLCKIESALIHIQKKLNINRTKKIEHYLGKGPNWVSITSDFAEYIVKNERIIKKYFWFTRCADEVFMHTLFNMSPFKNNLYVPNPSDNVDYSNMVYTDWDRGKPYTFSDEDLPELVESSYLFARKFDEAITIEKLKELIL
ncbi:beta-1,6-N-acetylglucosaminyltransferase [Butyrivibrio sp. AE2032]|uniref:beta-1,6-N-acetylglucosaminyltransferase n=1 Tax=Butyrivibrio sp. AE2032 TaxID=1458463 RepID=UPI0005513272|nr:beta-1,6-N-acetylglucosaminyltransferase [Butyrivibrio sp. AE2032]